jgi:hypothetical protein
VPIPNPINFPRAQKATFYAGTSQPVCESGKVFRSIWVNLGDFFH